MNSDVALSRIPTWVIVLSIPLLAAFALLVTVMSDAGSNAATTTRATPAGNTIDIKNFSFAPDPIAVKAGTTITVVNQDAVAHTFTANKGAFDTGDLDGGQRASVTVARAGTYAYHCEIHPFMKATVRVSP